MNNEIKFFTTKRNGKIAAWLRHPEDNRRINIGDFEPKEWTEHLQWVIKHAISLGISIGSDVTSNVLYKLKYIPDIPWPDEEN